MNIRLHTLIVVVCFFGLACSQLAAADSLDPSSFPGFVLDDTTGQKEGPWQPSTHSKPYLGEGYIHSGIPGDPISKEPKSITFRHKVPSFGKYAVYLAYNSGSNRAAQTPIEIIHAGGKQQFKLDQRKSPQGPGFFHLLGEFDFDPEIDAVVSISDRDAQGIVIVDGVVIVPRDEIKALAAATQQPSGSKPAEKHKEADKDAPAFVRQAAPDLGTLTPEQLDQLIAEHAQPENPTDLVDDEAFLRRVTLDVIGRIPTSEERDAFLNDPNPARRSLLVDRLLASPEFGQNWSTYWSDVFSYRIPQPELTFLDYEVFQNWLAEHLNQGTGWDEVTYQILTARGKVGDNPAAFFVGFHQANTSRLAGETTRIFLGTQIHCAECHDHPFVDIPQERFHQLAAFFVRTKSELPWNDSSQIVVKSKPDGEHKLPDSKKEMMPTTFTGQALAKGTGDVQRRVELARWITTPENPLFAKAYVNRMWERLMDRPFCEPIDEISELAGFPTLPEVHNRVAEHFAANQFEAKSLFRLILNTDAYQRKLDPTPDESRRLAAAQIRKMRGDVVFRTLATAINLPNLQDEPMEPTAEMRFPPPPKSTLDIVNEVFGYDPSLGSQFRPQTMQQAMFLMNNRQLQAQIDAGADSDTKLAQILDESPDDHQAITRLYVNVLARRPSDAELETAYEFVQESASRREAFEDLLWALLNTAEFTTRN